MNENPNIRDEIPPPYDIIGDVHGCVDELRELTRRLGYVQQVSGGLVHPDGRTLIFLGDLSDRGPGNIEVWRLLLASIDAGSARFVPGNHDAKLARFLQGRDVRMTHGFESTVRDYESLSAAERERLGVAVRQTILDAPPYLLLDEDRLVVAHAGLDAWMIGQVTREISIFARYGEKTGERTELDLPVRRDWVAGYRGEPLVVFGHTPSGHPEFRNNTINIDQGCVFGGSLTALRYPELETVSVPANRTYARPTMTERAADSINDDPVSTAPDWAAY